MENLFNDSVKSLETYIMFRIKQKAAELAPGLAKRGRAPIAMAMGAPVVPPPDFVIQKLTEALSIPDIHTYSTPRGESFYLEAVAKRLKNRFGVDLNPQKEIFSLIISI